MSKQMMRDEAAAFPCGVTITEEFITPKQAAIYLSMNHPTKQRRQSDPRVTVYRGEMEGGGWGEPPYGWDGIGFDVDEYMVNGQRRMKALAGAKVNGMLFLVTRGLKGKNGKIPMGDNGEKRGGAFLYDRDPNEWPAVRWLVELSGTTVTSAAYSTVSKLYGEIEATGALKALPLPEKKRERLTGSSTRAAFLLRWLNASSAERVILEQQYGYFTNPGTGILLPTYKRLYDEFMRGDTFTASGGLKKAFFATWKATEPGRTKGWYYQKTLDLSEPRSLILDFSPDLAGAVETERVIRNQLNAEKRAEKSAKNIHLMAAVSVEQVAEPVVS